MKGNMHRQSDKRVQDYLYWQELCSRDGNIVRE
jgi:hypothetical protein